MRKRSRGHLGVSVDLTSGQFTINPLSLTHSGKQFVVHCSSGSEVPGAGGRLPVGTMPLGPDCSLAGWALQVIHKICHKIFH